MEEDPNVEVSDDTPSVVYATLVTLDNNQDDGTGQPQLVTVPTDNLNGQEIDLATLAGLTGHNNLTVDLQNAGLAGQTFQVFQAGGEYTVVNTGSLEGVEGQLPSDSSVIVQSLPTEREEPEEPIQPPIPKGPYTCQLCNKIYTKWSQLQRHIKTHNDDQPYKCGQCDAGFNVNENLVLHEAIHRTPPVCPECGKKFSRLASLKAHIMLHERDESLICPECGDEFGVQSQLDRHMKVHKAEEDGLFECKHCQLEFQNMASLKEHMQQHVKVKHTTYKKAKRRDRMYHSHRCEYCTKRFEKPSQLRRHMRVHTGERPYACTVCSKSFNQKGALQLHARIHEVNRPFKCDHCPMRFSQKGNLRAHVGRVHSNHEENTFRCTECSCTFKRLGALNAHISRLHTTSTGALQASAAVLAGDSAESKPAHSNAIDDVVQQILACTSNLENEEDLEVKKRDLNKSVAEALAADNNLNTDILSQALTNSGLMPEGEKETQLLKEKLINAVSQAFSSLESGEDTEHGTRVILSASGEGLKKSLHTVRKVGGVRWHQCQYCTKEFKKPSDLVRHIRTHTQERPYKCHRCFRAFTVRSTLKAHERTHTGVKCYKCDICEKMFATHGSLKIHMRLHTGAKPFTCELCAKTFRTSGHLKSHEMSHFKGAEKARRLLDSNKGEELDTSHIELQEPIIITETGLVQQPPKHSIQYQNMMGEGVHDRPHKCSFCSQAFKKSSHLKQHIRSHTGEKPYHCTQCQRSFVSSGVLKAHMKTHIGLKNYKCVLCEALFTTNGSLKRHLSTHTDNRPFMCPYCQKTFKTIVNCKKHMKTHKQEIAMELQEEELRQRDTMDGTSLQDLQTPQQQQRNQSTQQTQEQQSSLMTSIAPQTADPLGVVDSTLLAGVSQQYMPSSADDMEENRTDTIIQDGQFTLNNQFVTANLGFSDRQILSQSFIGSNQQSLNQLNYNQPYTLDLGALASTNISNILLPRGSEVNVTPKTSTAPETSTEVPVTTTTLYTVQGSTSAQTDTQQADVVTVQAVIPQPISEMGEEAGEKKGENEEEPQASREVQGVQNDGQEQTTQEERADDVVNANAGGEAENVQLTEGTAAQGAGGERQGDGDNVQTVLDVCLEAVEAEEEAKPREPREMGVGKRRYDCTKCDKTFLKSSQLKEHMRAHAATKPFQCKKCKRAFVNQASLDKHAKSHASVKEFTCQLCNASYTSHTSLNIHMVTHATFKRYKCQLCDSHFSTSEQLNEHTKTDHLSSAVAPQEASRIKSGRVRPPRSRIHMVADDFINFQTSLGSKASTSKEGDAAGAIDHVAISERVLIEAAAEKGRVSEVKDQQKINEQLASMPKHAHQCKVCPRSFKKPSDLIRHFRIHTGEKPFRCDRCNKCFTVKSTLLSHQKTHKGHEKVYYCHLCSSPFATKGTLKVHMRLHTGAKPFKCAYCEATFRTSGHRKNHMQSHLKSQSERRASRKAGAKASSDQISANTQYVNVASLNQQTTGVLPLDSVMQLADGQTITPSLDGIQLQLTSTISGQPGIQISGIDPSMLSQPLPLHIDSNLLQQLQQSGNLNITFNTAGVLPGQAVTLDDQNLLQLTADGELLQTTNQSTEQQETQHLMTEGHIIDPESQGGEGTIQINNLANLADVNVGNASTTHLVIENSEQPADEGENIENIDSMLECNICGQVTKDENALAEHLLAHDKNAASARVKKVNKCTFCDRQFDKPSQLARHLRIHTGEKPYQCPHCQKSFSQKNTLQIHMSKHTGVRPYQCPLCDSKFTQKGNMKTHIRRAHPDETIIHGDSVDAELMYYEPDSTAAIDEEEEEQSAVSGHDNSLTAVTEEPMEAVNDENAYLLYNMRDHL